MLLNVLGFRQSDDSRCGVASVRSILYYYGIDTTEDEVARRCKHSYEFGCTNQDMAMAIRSFDLGANIFRERTIKDLAYWNRHRVPVIVDFFTPGINSTGGDMPNGHSGIIVDVDRYNVYLLDPEDGQVRIILHEDFERVWMDWERDSKILPTTQLDLGVMIVPFPNKLILG